MGLGSVALRQRPRIARALLVSSAFCGEQYQLSIEMSIPFIRNRSIRSTGIIRHDFIVGSVCDDELCIVLHHLAPPRPQAQKTDTRRDNVSAIADRVQRLTSQNSDRVSGASSCVTSSGTKKTNRCIGCAAGARTTCLIRGSRSSVVHHSESAFPRIILHHRI